MVQQVNGLMAQALGGPDIGGESFGWMVLKTALVLVAICVAAVVLLRWLGGRGYGKAFSKRRARRLEVLDHLSVAPNRAVQAIRAGRKVVLIGVGEGRVDYLCDLDPADWPSEGGDQGTSAEVADPFSPMADEDGAASETPLPERASQTRFERVK